MSVRLFGGARTAGGTRPLGTVQRTVYPNTVEPSPVRTKSVCIAGRHMFVHFAILSLETEQLEISAHPTC